MPTPSPVQPSLRAGAREIVAMTARQWGLKRYRPGFDTDWVLGAAANPVVAGNAAAGDADAAVRLYQPMPQLFRAAEFAPSELRCQLRLESFAC